MKLPLWRWKMEYGEEAATLHGWDDIMKAIDIDPTRCPKIPIQPRIMMSESPGLKVPEIRQDFSLVPRFQWGDFEAISYCWESDVRDRKVVINQTVFKIPRNLEAVLQRLRRLPDARSGMKFWVDALCINQRDVNEKNYQVKLMQSIYSKAFAVIVWLGGATHDSDKVVEFISSITHFTLAEEATFDPWDGNISALSRANPHMKKFRSCSER